VRRFELGLPRPESDALTTPHKQKRHFCLGI
jgi:hypothetical protein